MKAICLAVVTLTTVTAAALRAEVTIRVSFKVILGPPPGDEFPDNANTIPPTGRNLNSVQVIRDNIAFTNAIFARQAQGIRVVLRDNTVYQLTNRGGVWFTRDFRTVEARNALFDADNASAATRTDWQWHDDSVNVYLNDSRSGYCSIVADNRPLILVGAGAYEELLIHEMGHYFDLAHTHSGDGDGMLNWADGDGLSETLDDDADATPAQINARYPDPGNNQNQRDDLIFNIMSYHQPQDRFVWQQRQRWLETSNGARAGMVSGRFRFIAPDGSDPQNGLTWAARMRTLGAVHTAANSADDVMVIQSGTYNANTEGLPLNMNKAMTLTAWRGPVTINP